MAAMTDLPPDVVSEGAPEGLPQDPPAVVNTGKVCSEDGCDQRIPAHGEEGFAASRKKCDTHFIGSKHTGPGQSQAKKPGKKDGEGPHVDINLGGPKGSSAADRNVAKVAAGATQMAQTIGGLLMAAGQIDDGQAVLGGAEAWGKALGDLARYQPFLVTIFAPSGQMTGQAFAWVAVMAATAGIVLPIMHNHGAVSDETMAKLGMGMALAGAVDADPA